MMLCPPILITVASGRIRKSAAASAAVRSCVSVRDRWTRSASISTVVSVIVVVFAISSNIANADIDVTQLRAGAGDHAFDEIVADAHYDMREDLSVLNSLDFASKLVSGG